MSGLTKDFVIQQGRSNGMYVSIKVTEPVGAFGQERDTILENLMNTYASRGYRLCSMTAVPISKMDPGMGKVTVFVTFEKVQ